MSYKFILAIFSLVITLSAEGQNKTFIYAEKGNLYYGLDNPVQVIYNGKVLRPDEYEASIENGTCHKTDTALILNAGGYRFLCLQNMQGDTIYFKRIMFHSIPVPAITLNGKIKGGGMQKGWLLASTGLVALVENFNFEVRVYVNAYTAVIHSGNETFSIKCDGPMFSPELRAAIKKLRPHDRIEFTEIEAEFKTSSGLPSTLFRLTPMTFEIYGGLPYVQLDAYFISFDSLLQISRQDYYDALAKDKEIKTTCNAYCDTCSLDVFYRSDKKMSLSERYRFFANDSFNLKWYDKDKLLADISYSHGALSGPITLYYPDGKKRLEGSIKPSATTIYRDTVMTTDPVTLDETMVVQSRTPSLMEGQWNYYNDQGILVKTEKYADGKKLEK